jgi:hypothetical protein
MNRLLGIVVVYALMVVGWTTVGLFLLFAPVRAGKLLSEEFGLFSGVNRNDVGKKTILRLIGLGFLAFAVHFVLRIVTTFGETS